MSIVNRSIAAVLLAAAVLLGMQGLRMPLAGAQHPEFTPICGPFASPLSDSIQWGPFASQKLQQVLTIEGGRYIPETRSFSWNMRTNEPFPGELEEAEKKLIDSLRMTFKDKIFCALFYDAEGHKMGRGVVSLVIGERRPDGRFSVFGDLNLHNADLVSTRALITLCERPKLELPEPEKEKTNGKMKGEKMP